METIRSVNNPRIKQWSGLLKKKGRDETGQFLLEGLTSVLEAIQYGANIDSLILLEQESEKEEAILHKVKDAYATREDRMPDIVGVSEQVLHKVTETQTPQGVVAVVNQPSHSLKQLQLGKKGVVVLIDGVQDPGNLGTIIRTADAAGAAAVILGDGTVDLFNPKVVRSTMGSLFHLPIIKESLDIVIPMLKNSGVAVVGTRLADSIPHFAYPYPPLVAIVVGNEAQGVSSSIAEYIDQWVRIPMLGAAESLNVAIATAVILYESVRQHESK